VNPNCAAITGVGAVTPLGAGAEVLHTRWKAGESGLRSGVGMCHEFDPTQVMTRKEVRRTHRFVQLAVMACDEAIQMAWGGQAPYEPERIACILGCAFGGTGLVCEQHTVYQEGGRDAVWTLTVPVSMGNAPAAMLAIRHGLRGESYSISSACAAGTQAIGDALAKLRLGSADAVVAGGTEACVTDYFQALFRQAGALSRSGESRPFDRDRDGFVMGEGAGILILEQPEKALARGAEILGYVAGYASTTDAHHLTAPQQEGEMCARAMSGAIVDAGLAPLNVDYVNAHGTSTQSNDRAETVALRKALGDHAYKVPISAPKSVLGHSIGAAGGVEAVATLMALRDRIAPPTVGLRDPDDGLDLNYVPGKAVPLVSHSASEQLVGISNSFAFGGHNASVVLVA
jgi:3-oxoacyl-[acyl-carrier-protein] synthase II